MAARLLARAGELDQLHASGSTAADLCAAATEAGIARLVIVTAMLTVLAAVATVTAAVGAVRARGVSGVYDATGPMIA